MSNDLISIAVACEDPVFEEHAKALAQRLKIPYLEKINDSSKRYSFLLVQTSKHLELRESSGVIGGPVFTDFLQGKLGFRSSQRHHEQELIAKAVGLKGGFKPTILDVTAGLGRDSFILANLGCDVTLLERSPIIAALLQDGFDRFNAEQLDQKKLSWHLIWQEAQDYLAKLNPSVFPDVIYLDPMYPHRNKSALVKKEMRMLRTIAGDDPDAKDLLQLALTHAKKRVVVKRPRLGTHLGDQKPTFFYLGRSTRFDVYITSFL